MVSLLAGAMSVACIAGAAVVLWSSRRFLAGPSAAHARCVCGYERRGLPPGARCPECGRHSDELRKSRTELRAGLKVSLLPLLIGMAAASAAWPALENPYYSGYLIYLCISAPLFAMLSGAGAVSVCWVSFRGLLVWAGGAGCCAAVVYCALLRAFHAQPPDYDDLFYPVSNYIGAAVTTSILTAFPLLAWLLVLALTSTNRAKRR